MSHHSDRSARHIQDGGKAFEAGELIKAKLDRSIKKLTEASTYAKLNGRLSPDEQQTVRIIRSKQRAVDREWLAQFGSGKAMTDARIELKLQSKDDGTLIKFGEKMHSQGRLNCRACATTITEDALIPVTISRLCIHCQDGVEHVVDEVEIVPVDPRTDPGGVIPAGGPLPGEPRGQETTEKGEGKVVYTRYYYCDWCKHREEIKL